MEELDREIEILKEIHDELAFKIYCWSATQDVASAIIDEKERERQFQLYLRGPFTFI